MKSQALTILVGLATRILAGPTGSIRRSAGENSVVAGRYIVQLKPGASPESVTAHHLHVRGLLGRRDDGLEQTFQIGEFSAYTGGFDDQTVEAIASLPEVLTVEPDRIITIERTETNTETDMVIKRALTTQTSAPWSLGDLSHKGAGLSDYVFDESAGQGQTVYVLDTGIRLSHDEFEGRASWGFSGITNSTQQTGDNPDTEGHGTHVAGTVAGKTFGIAKKAKVIDVKVFEGAVGQTSWGLAGLNWAVNDIVSKGAQNTSVINLSLSTQSTDTAWDNAALAAYRLGITIVAAAGNNNGPASEQTPARVPQVITVGMTNPDRSRVDIIEGIYGSNYGPELDVFGPGRDIVSADHLSDTGSATKTGTSMAAPLVAGLICYLRASEGDMGSPDEVKERLLALAHKGVVTDPKGSPNVLVYNGSGQ